MILLYIIGGFFFIGLVATIFEKYVSQPLKKFSDRIRFTRNYSNRLSKLKIKIQDTDFDEISADLDNLKSAIQLQIQDFKKIKPHTLNTEQSEFEKSFLSSDKIAEKFLKKNGTV